MRKSPSLNFEPPTSREIRDRKRAEACYDKARAQLGDGWKHVSDTVRWAMICAEIIVVLEAQDEEISAESRIRLLSTLTSNARLVMQLLG